MSGTRVNNTDSKTVLVGNLPLNATTQAVETFLSTSGCHVKGFSFLTDLEASSPSTCREGMCTFASVLDAANAIRKLHGSKWRNRIITVKHRHFVEMGLNPLPLLPFDQVLQQQQQTRYNPFAGGRHGGGGVTVTDPDDDDDSVVHGVAASASSTWAGRGRAGSAMDVEDDDDVNVVMSKQDHGLYQQWLASQPISVTGSGGGRENKH